MNFQIIAKRYADALFAEIEETKGSKKIWEELGELASLAETNHDFANVIKNPTILDEEKKSVFAVLKKEGKISPILFNFLCLLVDKKRLALLHEIDKAIKKLVLNEEGEIEAEAVFASIPKAEAKKELVKKLSDMTGKKVILHEVIDPTVIGGVKVRMGSILYDATIKGQVEKLKATLINS